ncbi:galactose oxidase [Backusella circina FSU 941]|nr:galactose oxidase [Backusella circina FSU 941]
MPFMSNSSCCYIFDFETEKWEMQKLQLVGIDEIQPQITCAVAINGKIYLVGGRYLKSYTLSNGMLEIDINSFTVKVINDASGTPPRPRHEHSVDILEHRYLVIFGGLCYNSVGENDVFVYDIFDNRWFVPPINGHLPHLRFGHASAVIGNNLYVHGGAQLDNDSSYIVYDDLYRLDCETWTWYKYEHPEVERYLRSQTMHQGQSPPREHLISTTGDNPLDRFQAYMCSFGTKLIIFGGHSIREDKDDNEILFSYPIDELSVFSTKRNVWTMINSVQSNSTEDQLTVSDMSVAVLPTEIRGIRIYIFAGLKTIDIQFSSHYPDRIDNGLSLVLSNQYNYGGMGESSSSVTGIYFFFFCLEYTI